MINTNNPGETLRLSDLPYGKTQNIEVKIGRGFYLVDVDKTSDVAFVELYRKFGDERNTYSKYDPECERCALYVRETASLGKDFFRAMPEIAATLDAYKRIEGCFGRLLPAHLVGKYELSESARKYWYGE